jgi:hypothetical protein
MKKAMIDDMLSKVHLIDSDQVVGGGYQDKARGKAQQSIGR